MKAQPCFTQRQSRFTQRWVALFAAALTAASGHAAKPDTAEARWYQVELIIFTQRSPDSDPKEIWPRDLALAYPPNWIELKTPEPPQSDAAAGEGATEPPPSVDLAREPYYLLPRSERELTPQARDLKRGGRYRVLFHQAWRQPMINIQKAPGLLIQGGNTYGDHSELEGSITISIARYLHLSTNLWLSAFSANYGQESGSWPDLPHKPIARKVAPGSLLTVDTGAADWWERAQPAGGEYESILASPFVVDQIVTFRQKRSRMRSGEVHYLDHPQMGLLIKMMPYEVPEVEPEQLTDSTGIEPAPAAQQ